MATILKRTAADGTVSYQVKIRMKGHPPESATFERITDAKKWAADTESSIRHGRHFKTSAARKHTVAEMIERYLKRLEKSNARRSIDVRNKLNWWKDQLGYATLADVSKALIIEKRDLLMSTPQKSRKKEDKKAGEKGEGKEEEKKKFRAPATVNRYMTVLSHAFTIAVNEWEWLEHHPLRKVSKLKEPRGIVRFLSDEERKTLLEVCERSESKYLHLIVVLALSTGARRGEVLNIRWQDVDFQRRVITLHETKNGERRVLPLVGHALALMQKHAKVRKLKSDYVFPGKGNKPYDVSTSWKLAIKRSKIPNFRFHDLRHSAASALAMDGASLAEIAEVLGHKTLAMVKRYSHLSETHVSNVVERMNKKLFG